MLRFLLGFVAALATVALGLLIYVYSGGFNVAASTPSGPVATWVMDQTMQRSVKARARGDIVPGPVSSERLQAGFREYDAECVQCHGAPGVERAAWAEGMHPVPPSLARAAKQWTAAELYWIIENGVRMTGMPAMGAHHSDEDLRNIVAFVEALPHVTAEDYRRMRTEQAERKAANGSPEQAPHRH